MSHDPDQQFLRDHAGQWVAWDRGQTHVVASGSTFEQVKSAAAQAGERSVLVAKVPARASWMRKSHKLLYVFAVFISLGQPLSAGSNPDTALPQASIADNTDDDSADDGSFERRGSAENE